VITVRWPMQDNMFPQVEFRRLFGQIRRPVSDGAEMVTAYTNGMVTLRSNRRLDGYHEAADMSGMQGVKAGDFVVHGLDILRGSIGVSDADGAITSVCVVCKPISDADPRYFAWQIRAQAASGLPRALARGVREGGADFRRWDTLAELPVLCPPADLQRVIADYLDTETTRIDALITKKQQMIELCNEAELRMIDDLLTLPDATPILRLGYVARLQTGITLDSNRDAGPHSVTWPYLRVANVQAGSLDLQEIKQVTVPQSLADGTRLRAGDVLMTEGGDLDKLGRGTIWTGEIEPCLHQNHVFAVRCDVTKLLPEYLAYITQSSRARSYFESTGTRSTNLASTNSSKVLALRLPLPSLEEQAHLVSRIRLRHERNNDLIGVLSRQIDLLREHRHALITAAVTGEFEVPGVAA
jgi:type I restriction enzyme S subunit